MPDFQRNSHEGYTLASAGCLRREPPAPAAQQVTQPQRPALASAGACGMQVAQYVISGLTQALDNCSQASAAPYGVVTVGAITRTNVNKAAVTVSHLSSPLPAANNKSQWPGLSTAVQRGAKLSLFP